jgi:hypothetical protein
MYIRKTRLSACISYAVFFRRNRRENDIILKFAIGVVLNGVFQRMRSSFGDDESDYMLLKALVFEYSYYYFLYYLEFRVLRMSISRISIRCAY